MPKDKNIKKVMLIGSGPISIGQAAEFDYAGTQACRVLRDEGVEIVLVNSNPATIMTDSHMADKIYIEPLTLTTVERIIDKERPDSILSGLGGQTGLNLCMHLAREGILEEYGVRLLGSSPQTIDRAEDRKLFKETMESIGQPVIPSVIANDVASALEFASENGYPVIIRPAFTLGGSGGGIANDENELRETARSGLEASPIHQILVERSVAGWKEIEFEVLRDRIGNSVAVCSMENLDPVGVHTGDSIVVAPALTLADREFQMLRSAALDIIEALGVEGGCNCQFALNPESFEYAVIEVNPRVSRSSALASKATGYPIAKVSTRIALGYTLDEIPNAVTGRTCAMFEPALDYVALKIPKWPFDKFVYANRTLGTQMKATGEVMSIAPTFEEALLKALRGTETGHSDLNDPLISAMDDETLKKYIHTPTDKRIFAMYEGIKRGMSTSELHTLSGGVDEYFIEKLKNIACGNIPSGKRVYRMVDTCAGEFEASTPYFYASNGTTDEAAGFVRASKKPKVVVIGSGPIRIGQGIEFDYACVRCVGALKELGYDAIVINNNPETVSTDFDISDRLYFEPLTFDDVMGVIKEEDPVGVIVAFGGGTSVKLAKQLDEAGVKIIGTPAEAIDLCEDRDRFDKLLEELDIKRPKGLTATTPQAAIEGAGKLGYPVLMRPSYVLGGQNMIIAFERSDAEEYAKVIFGQKQDRPVLIDKYMSGLEIEVDALCDGTDVLIPGIMEHVERTGIHSGDSIAVYPALHVDDGTAARIFDITKRMCIALGVRGLVNAQYIVAGSEIYVIEINPRASRTVPYLSKVTGVPMCALATKLSLGQTLAENGYHDGIYPRPPYVSVKVPVFSFEKLSGVDTQLGPEMKSTGEVLGIGINIKEALYKGLTAAGYRMKRGGGVLLTVRDGDKDDICAIAEKFHALGFRLYATAGTGAALKRSGLEAQILNKLHDDPLNNPMTALEGGEISYIVSTSAKGRDPALDDVKIRRRACALGIPCLTSTDTANALVDSIMSGYSEINTGLVDINSMRKKRLKLPFIKMVCAGNDYIYIDNMSDTLHITCPEALSPALADRHFGIGADGVVMMQKSDIADAKMRLFNHDGSEGRTGGNALCCVAKYLYESGKAKKQEISIETKSGVKKLYPITTGGLVTSVRVDMGEPEYTPSLIPTTLSGDSVIARKIELAGNKWNVTCLSVGNPHAVIFCSDNTPDIDSIDVPGIGSAFENSDLFPEGVNVEFVHISGANTLKMRVWERGNGETLACGTGACAAAAAAVANGICSANTDIRVMLRGGELTIRCAPNTLYLTATCSKAFEGIASV